MLRDHFVAGINDSRIQHCLLAKKDLTFQTAYDIALAMKTADHDVLDLQKSTAVSGSVNAVRTQLWNRTVSPTSS